MYLPESSQSYNVLFVVAKGSFNHVIFHFSAGQKAALLRMLSPFHHSKRRLFDAQQLHG